MGSAGVLAQGQPPQPDGLLHHQRRQGTAATSAGSPAPTQHCQRLAAAAGAGNDLARLPEHEAAAGAPAVNARDRIGNGPWYNAKGALIAANVADLHGDVERDRNLRSNGARPRRAKP